MPPPVGFKQLMEKIETIEDQCSDESDKEKRQKGKLKEKEMGSTDPFVQKKIHIQEKIAETNEVRDTQLLALCTSWCRRGRASSRYSADCARIGPAARRPCDHRLCGREGWARSAGRDPRGSRRHPMPLRGTHMGARRLRQCRPPPPRPLHTHTTDRPTVHHRSMLPIGEIF